MELQGSVNSIHGNRTVKVAKKEEKNEKAKVVVIMGATGTGKSRLAIDLASQFPIEIINADSMQVYHGLDVLTNKVPLLDQKGVPHHLLGTICPNAEFTSKNFRDSAIPIIDEILERKCLPVIVGGTNYYIQALVSSFLLDDSPAEYLEEHGLSNSPGDTNIELGGENLQYSYECLKDVDPVAANRIHPNDHRKVTQYLSLFARSGVLPSQTYQEKSMEKWGRVDNLRYDCCFICVDASLPILDKYVDRRVDCMVDEGLLDEVFEIYNMNADYTRGLKQAIGVREFEVFLKAYFSENEKNMSRKEDMKALLNMNDDPCKILLEEAIEKVKLNTRRLVRRQKRRVNRLQTLFGWKIHFVNTSEALLGNTHDSWDVKVIEPSEEIIRSFLNEDVRSLCNPETVKNINERDLWTQYICEACENRVLRGAHEWEQHKQGRCHRKRVSSLKKSCQGSSFCSRSEITN